jgi:acyl transferase domain-containing protein
MVDRGAAGRTAVSVDEGGRAVAVIGMSCRLPGAASDRQLWDLLCASSSAVSALPSGRFDATTMYSPVPATAGKIASRCGGVVDAVDLFDADFFGIDADEAARMDPQQRLLLMAAWEALEDAGQPPSRYRGTRTGVFVGEMNADYWDVAARQGFSDLTLYSFTGSHQRSMTAARVSYAFDFRGTSMVVDTACSSSSTAVHLACQSLLSGESSMAVAAGVNLMLTPHANVMYSQARMLAPDGRCKFADTRADGLVRSDGVGVVVLKPLSRAIADGDPVRAVILGSAVGNDGADRPHIAAPAQSGMVATMRRAYEVAGVDPCEVDYVEAHGTGTRIDVVEMAALAQIVGANRPPGRPCVVGSIKTNIGHCEAAAGIAGLIKTVLCLEHSQVPANLHLETPHPKIDWDHSPLVVPTRMHTLEAPSRPLRAAVNSQGVSSTNVHLVLGQADPSWWPDRPSPVEGRAHLLALSARTPAGRDQLARSYLAFLAGEGRSLQLRDICFSAGPRHEHHPVRLAAIGTCHDELIEGLRHHLSSTGQEKSPTDDAAVRVISEDSTAPPPLGETAQQYLSGDDVEWERIGEEYSRCVRLPTYPWQLSHYWLDDRCNAAGEPDAAEVALR